MRHVTAPGAAAECAARSSARRAGPGSAGASASPCPCRAARPSKSGTSPWPARLFSSPKCSVSTACTAWPRVPLGSSATLHAADRRSAACARRCWPASRRRPRPAPAAACGLKSLHRLRHVDALRRRRALRLVGRQVGRQGAVGRPAGAASATRCTSASVSVAHAVAEQEEQAPVALRDRLRQRHADRLGVGEGLFPALEPLGLGALQFLGA